jgi:hypothetical protein
MIASFKTEWVAGLAGNYQQEEIYLRKDNAYSALGVLCDLVADRVGLDWIFDPVVSAYSFGGSLSNLPGEVRELCGISRNEEKEIQDLQGDGWPLVEIAKFIRENL